MKNKNFKTAISAFLILAVSISSCKKIVDDPDPTLPVVQAVALLTKVTVLSSSSNSELTQLAIEYDVKGNVTSVLQDGTLYKPTFNAKNQLISLSQTYNNISSISTAEYNGNGQIVKITFGNGTEIYSTTAVTYNTAGKISQIANTSSGKNPNTITTEYTWIGDNISKEVRDRTTTEYLSYDDKPNAYTSFKDIRLILFGSAISKNNATESNNTFGGVVGNQKFAFEYNKNGYPSLLKPSTKYYYAP